MRALLAVDTIECHSYPTHSTTLVLPSINETSQSVEHRCMPWWLYSPPPLPTTYSPREQHP